MSFRYQVVRVWELPVAQLLAGGPGMLPLATIGAGSREDLPGVIAEIKTQLALPELRELASELWTSVDVLLGLRYERGFVDQLLRGVPGMEESVTYQAIVEKGVEKGVVKGRLEGVRRILLRQGKYLLGKPAGAVVTRQLEAVSSLDILEGLADRVLQVKSWDELVADLPPVERASRKKKS